MTVDPLVLAIRPWAIALGIAWLAAQLVAAFLRRLDASPFADVDHHRRLGEALDLPPYDWSNDEP